MLLLWAQVQRIKLILLLRSCQVITLVHGIPLLFLFFPFKKCSWKCVLIFCTWILYLHTRFYVIYFMFPNVFSISTVFLRSIHVVLWIHLALACNSWQWEHTAPWVQLPQLLLNPFSSDEHPGCLQLLASVNSPWTILWTVWEFSE